MTWSATVATNTPYAEIVLLGCEALAGVQPDALAVEHRVLHDRDGQLRVLVWPAEPLRERRILGECLGEIVRDALGQAGGEQAGRDRQHPDPHADQIAVQPQEHS